MSFNSQYSGAQLEEMLKGASKYALFDDMWLNAVGKDGSIDHSREDPYILLGVGHTYEEALYALKFGITDETIPAGGFYNFYGKAILVNWNTGGGSGACRITGNNFISGCTILKVIKFAYGVYLGTAYAFGSNNSLEYIYGDIWINNAMSTGSFNCPLLKEIRIRGLQYNIFFTHCPLLSLESFQFLIANAANTTDITVTVHPDVYAKMTDEGNAEWNKVFTDAVAKKIAFATV